MAIRMYRQGLGDCFLLAFSRPEGPEPTYFLIDCSVHANQPYAYQLLKSIVQNVCDASGNRLDVVVGTHESRDYLSGFLCEADRFLNKSLSVGRVWLPWTENQEDVDAYNYSGGKTLTQQAIDQAQRLRDGRGSSEDPGVLGARRRGEHELAFDLLKSLSPRPLFLEPKAAPLSIPGTSDARAYVLGPPRENNSLDAASPTSGALPGMYLSSTWGIHSFAAAFRGRSSSETDAEQRELDFPFDARFRRSYEEAAKHELFRAPYDIDSSGKTSDWRGIQEDWLETGRELALQLDQHVNNTSAALAFELGPPGAGPVMLFAAGAQAGSWLSWRRLKWTIDSREVTLANLLSRTIVYKVGHHGSHNATLKRDDAGRPYGLDLMRDGVLALLTVDEKVAGKIPGLDLPNRCLYQSLKNKTRGNILRSDDDADPDLAIPRIRLEPIPGVEDASWCRSAEAKIPGGSSLYYDVYLKPGAL